MGSSMTRSHATAPVMPSQATGMRTLPTTPRELATQTPRVISYTLQQFVRLSGAQCRMSPAEVAYHNRARRTR